MTDNTRMGWRALCELAAEEKNPKKLLELVEDILHALDDRNNVRWLPREDRDLALPS